MNITEISKPEFAIIGKQGSTRDGDGFIGKLWEDANGHFDQVSSLAKRDEQGALVGVWGAMSDFSLSFRPWEEDFRQGLYLAGVECPQEAQPPEGWVKWLVPGFTYICLEAQEPDAFAQGLTYLREHDLPLAGAVQEFTDPASGKSYLYFPIARK